MEVSTGKTCFRPEDIPTMPAIAGRVMKLLSMPVERIEMRELTEVINSDSALASKLLKIANSPFYGFSRKIDTVKEALPLLGLSAIKGMVINVAMRSISKNPDAQQNMLWEHSVGVAIASRELARELRCCDPDNAFTAGLMHDFGKSVIYNSSHPNKREFYKEMIGKNRVGAELIEYEEAFFGFSHLSIGEMVVEKWNLSDDLAICLSHHHVPDEQTIEDSANPNLLCVVAQANILCHFLGIGIHDPLDEAPIKDNPAARYLKQLQADRIENLADMILQAFEEQKNVFLHD